MLEKIDFLFTKRSMEASFEGADFQIDTMIKLLMQAVCTLREFHISVDYSFDKLFKSNDYSEFIEKIDFVKFLCKHFSKGDSDAAEAFELAFKHGKIIIDKTRNVLCGSLCGLYLRNGLSASNDVALKHFNEDCFSILEKGSVETFDNFLGIRRMLFDEYAAPGTWLRL